jgi:hypothetical protein
MKFAYFIITIINRLRFSMVTLFIYKCLLFRSKEKTYWILGILAWLSLILLVYAVYCIVGNTQSVCLWVKN